MPWRARPATSSCTSPGPTGRCPTTGTISVIGPGTGLGVAHLYRDAGGYHVSGDRGRPHRFRPARRDRRRDPRAPAQAASRGSRSSGSVAGPAIVRHLPDARRARGTRGGGGGRRGDLDARHSAASDSLAAAAVDRFCLSLGSVAGDYRAGAGRQGGRASPAGSATACAIRCRARASAQRFRAKGRYDEMMAGIPVKLIVHPQPGLFGAAAAFQHRSIAMSDDRRHHAHRAGHPGAGDRRRWRTRVPLARGAGRRRAAGARSHAAHPGRARRDHAR